VDTQFGQVLTFSDLDMAEWIAVNLPLTVPTSLSYSTTYFLGAILDHNQQYQEGNFMDNNILRLNVRLQIPSEYTCSQP
jgi:hypothetical protein